MKILLIGEYSSVHCNLAEGLRALGHTAVVMSDGDMYKNYPRDIDLSSIITVGQKLTKKQFVYNVYMAFKHLRGYDVVHLINPIFFGVNPLLNRIAFDIIRALNRKVFLGLYGDDYYFVKASRSGVFKYSNFDAYKDGATDLHYAHSVRYATREFEKLTKHIARYSNGLIAGAIDYTIPYKHAGLHHVHYIPFPMVLPEKVQPFKISSGDTVNVLLGKFKGRNLWKGSDIIENMLHSANNRLDNTLNIQVVESVPYDEYKKVVARTHVVADQLYFYSLAMNGLLALSQGKVVVGGGEEEMYEALGETILKPVINITPDFERSVHDIANALGNKRELQDRSRDGIEFVHKHHNHVKVAQEYLDYWNSK